MSAEKIAFGYCFARDCLNFKTPRKPLFGELGKSADIICKNKHESGENLPLLEIIC